MSSSRRTPIAEGPFCGVEECSCGVLHVTIGALTLRVQAEVLESIWLTLGEAMARLATKPRSDRAPVFDSCRAGESS